MGGVLAVGQGREAVRSGDLKVVSALLTSKPELLDLQDVSIFFFFF